MEYSGRRNFKTIRKEHCDLALLDHYFSSTWLVRYLLTKSASYLEPWRHWYPKSLGR